MSLSRLLDVMSGDNDGLIAILSDLNQMVPYTLSKQGIHTNSWFIQNQQFWVMHECYCERHSSLLTTTADKNKQYTYTSRIKFS